MAIDYRMIHFRDDDVAEVVAEVERITDRGDADEWLTISPWVDDDDLPVTSALRRVFSARGPRIPEVTWVPAHGREPAQLGIRHATGPQAHDRAAQGGAVVPEAWVMVNDHTKRGLLYAVHPATSADTIIAAALGLARALAEVPTDDRWVAQVSSAS